MPITPLPPLDRTSATFRNDVDTFFGSQIPTFVTEANALETNVNNKEASATTKASEAASSATLAQNWATKTDGEVVTGQGFGAKKYAQDAAGSATAASTSASDANAAKTAAQTAQAAAEAAFDSLDDRYLGAKASDPTTDNDGNALLAGALYFNSTVGEMRVWSGSAWAAAYLPASGYATLNGTETLTNKTLSAPVVNGYTEGSATASGTAFSPNLAADTVFGYSTTGNATITLPAPAAGKSFQLQITYGGAHSITWSGSVAWAADTAPTPTSTSGKTDIINFTCNVAGTKWIGAVFAQGVTL